MGTFTTLTNANFSSSFKFDSLPYWIFKCGFDNRVKSRRCRQQGRSTDLSVGVTSASLLAVWVGTSVFLLFFSSSFFIRLLRICNLMGVFFASASFDVPGIQMTEFYDTAETSRNHFCSTVIVLLILFVFIFKKHLNASYFISPFCRLLSFSFSWGVST